MDILAPALSLEETYYAEGLALGQADGAKAGLVEGRRFGLEKGFEKFASMGQLHGRSIVWNARAATAPIEPVGEGQALDEADKSHEQNPKFLPQMFNNTASSAQQPEMEDFLPPPSLEMMSLPPFASGPSASRLQKHVVTLYALTEPESLSVENNEEAISDFDDRYRRAVAKGSILGRITGETVDGEESQSGRKEIAGEKRGGEGVGEGEGELEDIMLRKGLKTSQADRTGDRNDLEIEIR